jgi:hypothetical protein
MVHRTREIASAPIGQASAEIASPMSARDFARAVKAFEKSIGPRASISTFLAFNDGAPLYCAVYPTGNYSKGADFSVQAETFSELFAAVQAKWAEYEADHRVRTIRKMALAIIRITAELGECTDAALRNCGEFDPGQINAYGEQACADANEIAGKGPFSIVVMGGANAEAAA